jgi:hypothetical protein
LEWVAIFLAFQMDVDGQKLCEKSAPTMGGDAFKGHNNEQRGIIPIEGSDTLEWPLF